MQMYASRRRPVILASVAVIAMLVMAAVPLAYAGNTPGSGSYGEAVVTHEGQLAVREGPSVGFRTLGSLPYGTRVLLMGRSRGGDWLYVNADGLIGWSSSRYLETSVVFSTLPVLASSEPYAEILTGTATLRAGPGADYAPVAYLEYGTPVSMLGRNTTSTWVLIRHNTSTVGWVNAGLLANSVSVSTLTVMASDAVVPGAEVGGGGEVGGGSAPAGALPTATHEPRVTSGGTAGGPTAVPHVVVGGEVGGGGGGDDTPPGTDNSGGFPYVEQPLGEPNATPVGGVGPGVYVGPPKAGAEVGGGGVSGCLPAEASGIVMTGRANVRSGPGMEYPSIGTVAQYDRVLIVARDARSNWLLLVFADCTTGWVSAGLIDSATPYAELPVAQ